MTKEDMTATIKAVVKYLYNDVGDTWYGDLLNDVLTELKDIDITPAKHGHWIDKGDSIIAGTCSVCGWNACYDETDVSGMPYCPHCGAKMDGVE